MRLPASRHARCKREATRPKSVAHARKQTLVFHKISKRRCTLLPRAVPDAAQPEAPTSSPAYSLPKASKYIYEGTFGLPVVREQVSYSELLRDVRTGKVAKVHFFKDDVQGTAAVDGPCLIEYKTGSVRQARIPMQDVRLRYAMETHGVNNYGLATMPAADKLKDFQGFPLQRLLESSIKYMPVIGLVGIWLAVQFREIFKGDYTDREMMRKREAQDMSVAKQQQMEDDKILGIQKMVIDNHSEEHIRQEVARLKLELEEEELQAILTEARRMKARQERGTWVLEEDEEERVRARRQSLSSGGAGGDADDVSRMKGLRIRKARLRSVNRTRLKGKLKNVEDEDVFFDDVAGIDLAKQELAEIVDFFNFPERYAKSGARSPRGCLLYGPPGTGKTLLARAVAGEANATFLGVNASEFVEMFIGVGAARVRDLFQTARDSAPAVIFIDEIDAVGRVRGASQGNDERDQTLNQMLSEMDGFDARSGVVVIAATNRRDVLDPALIRPGRFDRQVYVGPPSREGRVDVLKVHLRKFTWDQQDVRLKDIAFATDGYSGSMLANLCNLAALMANRDGRLTIKHADFISALTFERQGLPVSPHSPDVMRRIAVVEASTALAATLMPAIEPVELVTARPTELRAMGQTVLKLNEQRALTSLHSKRYLEEQLRVTLAGRAAERLLCGEDEVSTLTVPGINDARHIVHKLVLSSALRQNSTIGPTTVSQPYRSFESAVRLQQYIGPNVSSETLNNADSEMEQLLVEAESDVYALLERNRKCLEALIEQLASDPYQLTGEQVRKIVEREAHSEDLDRRREVHENFV